eukprot:m.103976 g.103976  ORF g.103976 m.103976 type:complete len:311 (-) comp13829_c1_seq2:117-1049(-)
MMASLILHSFAKATKVTLLPKKVLGFNIRCMSSLKNRGCIVTGGTKGIGKAVVEKLLEKDAIVVACSRTQGDIEDLQNAFPSGKLLALVCDVSNEKDQETLVVQAKAWLNDKHNTTLSVLINNVGTNVRKPTTEYSSEELHNLFNTNFFSVFRLSQLLQPELIRAAQERGESSSIVNMSSVSGGPTCTQTGPVYAATKGAMNQFTKYAACEWGPVGVRVNGIAPWYIATPMVDALLQNEEYKNAVLHRTPMQRVGRPEEVADAALFLASDESSFITGSVLAVDGGFTSSGFGFYPGFSIPSAQRSSGIPY